MIHSLNAPLYKLHSTQIVLVFFVFLFLNLNISTYGPLVLTVGSVVPITLRFYTKNKKNKNGNWDSVPFLNF